MKYPDVYIVGAAKSGTTALANLLKSSDEVFVPEVKEPHFHIAECINGKIPFVIKSDDEYSGLYSRAREDQVKIDASVLYLPFYEKAIPNIKKYSGDDAKIIIILRDPLQRAISAYKHSLRYNAKENLSFDEAVRADRERRHGNPMLCYKWLSEYSPQVKAYDANFSNLLILSSEDFRLYPQEVLASVSEFLEVSEITYSQDIESNKGDFSWKSNFFRMFLNKVFPGQFRYQFRRYLPGLYKAIKKLVFMVFGRKSVPEISVSEETRALFAQEKIEIDEYLGGRLK